MSQDDAVRNARPRSVIPTEQSFRFWTQLRTRNRDTDQFGHVNHAAMATLFEEARVAVIFAAEMRDETAGVDLLVASLHMAFHKELRAPGDVRIGSSIYRIGSSSLDIRQGIFVGGECYASTDATCVLLGKESRRPARASEQLRGFLMLDDE